MLRSIPRYTIIAALFGAVAGAALLVARISNSISFVEPLQLTTSGAEYESLFVFWRYVHGLTIYADHFKIPFAGTFYNWLYYAFYGEIIEGGLHFFSLDDAWLPTAARLVTLSGALYGVFISYRCFVDFVPAADRAIRILCFAFAVSLYVGPLAGFFSIASQPDIWGTASDVTGLYLFLRYYPDRPIRAVVLLALFGFCAWSFKQVSIHTIAAVCALLILRQDWKRLFILVAILCCVWMATLLIGSPQYRYNILQFGGASVIFSWATLQTNLVNFAVKMTPLIFGLAASAMILLVRRKLFATVMGSLDRTNRPALSLALLGSVISGGLSVVASAKMGAAENYYFLPAFYLILLLIQVGIFVRDDDLARRWLFPALTAGFALHVLAVVSVFAGIFGILSPRPLYAKIVESRQCLLEAKLEAPVFIAQEYMSLPWMYPADQNFVIQMNYRWDRPRGVPMEGGGIGGLIDSGYFGSVALHYEETQFDGATLHNYRADEKLCGVFRIYRRVGTNETHDPAKN